MKIECPKCSFKGNVEFQKMPHCPDCGQACRIIQRLDAATYFEKVETYRSALPEHVRGLFDEMIANNKGPDPAMAGLLYLTEDKTQKELADEFGLVERTVRNAANSVSTCDVFFSEHDDFDVGLFEVFKMFDYKTLQQWAKGSDAPVDGQSSAVDIAEQLAIQDNAEELVAVLERIEEELEAEGWLSQDDVKELIQ